MRKKPVIGLLGGVGSGKSTAAAEFVRLGCGLVDADAIGHELLDDPAVQAEFRRLWGAQVFDAGGSVDRAAVARITFGSPGALAELNAVMHPRIREGIMRRIAQLEADPTVAAIILDAALLLETDWHRACTTFVFVKAPEPARAERVAKARGWDDAAWRLRENSQKPLDMKAAKADHIVDNSSSLSRLCEQVRAVFHQIVHSADRPQDQAQKRP